MFKRILEAIRKPGAMGEVQGFAATQSVSVVPGKKDVDDEEIQVSGFLEFGKPRLLDRWLDKVVQASGSEPVFYSILTGLVTWGLLGIRFGHSETWQVAISDVQAILSYAFDSLLVRQQLNMYDREIIVAAQMRSRMQSNMRMLSKVCGPLGSEEKATIVSLCEQQDTAENNKGHQLPSEGRFGMFITTVSHILGHIITVGLFWVGVVVWIGIGPLYHWSDIWQLYMNSVSSAWMVLYFAFLANIRERHSAHNKKCLDALFATDSELEVRLRSLSGDVENNPRITVPAPKVGRLQRAIFYYADFVGTLVGIAILMTVMIVWVATGPIFGFSANWWLFIGTYAGLVGMNDGFVLRNMQSRLGSYVDQEMNSLGRDDKQLFQSLGLSLPRSAASDEQQQPQSVTQRISLLVEKVSAHELTVAAGVLTILGLLAGASAQRWSLTGQLLCNVPPSLIESFFMMILVTGHNHDDEMRRAHLQGLYEKRLRLLRYVDVLQKSRAQPVLPTIEEKEDVGGGSLAIPVSEPSSITQDD